MKRSIAFVLAAGAALAAAPGVQADGMDFTHGAIGDMIQIVAANHTGIRQYCEIKATYDGVLPDGRPVIYEFSCAASVETAEPRVVCQRTERRFGSLEPAGAVERRCRPATAEELETVNLGEPEPAPAE